MKASSARAAGRVSSRYSFFATIRAFPAALCRRDGGGVAVYVGLALMVLVACIGIGFDTGRAWIVRSRLSTALDAAALAGGLKLYDASRDADIRMYFEANFPKDDLGVTLVGPTIVVDEEAETVTVTASATVDTTLMRILGFDDMTVSAEAEVTRRMTALDVVLSMDVSGSMNSAVDGGGTRLAASKDAAEELVNILFGNDSMKELLNIGVVPWSSKVNVGVRGQVYDHTLTHAEPVPSFVNPETGAVQSEVYYANNSPVPLLFPPAPDWKGCVFNRFKVVIKPTRSDGTVRSYNAADDGIANDADILRGPQRNVGGLDWPGWSPVHNGEYPKRVGEVPDVADAKNQLRRLLGGEEVENAYSNGNDDWRGRCGLAPDGKDCVNCPPVGILPLQHSKTPVVEAIDDLEADGATNIVAGLSWAWEVLMPDAPFDEAIPDPDYDRNQAIVLMTDGIHCNSYGDAYKGVFGTCYDNTAISKMNDRLLKLADNVKNSGVLIYAIQFVESDAAQIALMKKVASGPQAPYYYYAPSKSELKKAFREIANHLSELRLSK